jgi:hypothetical protein
VQKKPHKKWIKLSKDTVVSNFEQKTIPVENWEYGFREKNFRN